MLFKNLDFVWLKEIHQVSESTSEPKNSFVRKNLREPDPEPAKNLSQSGLPQLTHPICTVGLFAKA